ncbi:hypothetical protein [Puerhibacterium puerhi]|uniref:hypothetical protein n=1 Tax=Puerhibacterium puerhi TaxID=2692623 RepID=UPI00135C80D3|nr:hypothetical protein [Puerhibacterium puerhi]
MLVVGVASLTVAACASTQSAGCASWVDFKTPADAAADADAVVIGTVAGRGDDVRVMGGDAHTWTVEVADWVRGHGGSPIVVTPMPDHCGEDPPYPGGDPLRPFADDGTPVMLFLREGDAYDLEEGVYTTLTPYQGVIPAPVDGRIPEEW